MFGRPALAEAHQPADGGRRGVEHRDAILLHQPPPAVMETRADFVHCRLGFTCSCCKEELFFGSKNIPELAKGLGKGMREFKDAMAGIENEVKNAANETTPPVKKIEEAPVVAKAPEQSVAKAAEIPSTESPAQTDYDNQPKGN